MIGDHANVLILNEPLDSQINALPTETLCSLAKAIGNSLFTDLGSRTNALKAECIHADSESLAKFDDSNWLDTQNPVLISFLHGAVFGSHDSTDTIRQKIPHIVTAVDCIYKARNLKYIGPISFRNGLLIYNQTRSKITTELLAKLIPSGVYSVYRNWLEQQSLKPLKLPSFEKDIIIVFDNQQVIGKTYRLSVDTKPPCSVITASIFIQLNSSLQFQTKYHDCPWFPQIRQSENMVEDGLKLLKYLELTPAEDNIYNKIVAEHYVTWMNMVASDLSYNSTDDGQITDLSDSVAALETLSSLYINRKVCQFEGCGSSYSLAKQKCDTCQSRLPSSKDMADLYAAKCEEVRQNYPKSPLSVATPSFDYLPNDGAAGGNYEPKIILGQPIFKAPNSYDNVAEILRSYGRELGVRRYKIPGERYFVWICVDGQPYSLITVLQRETLYCCACEKGFFGPKAGDGLAQYEKHCVQVHSNNNPRLEYEFNWVLLLAGPGHVEYNMIKTVIDFCWDPFLHKLAEALGYRSPMAQKVFRNVSDHHKGYDACVAIRNGLTAELVTPYIIQTALARATPNLSDFAFYIKNAKNKNFPFIYACVNNLFECINLYRYGIRTNDSTAVTAGLKLSLVPFFLRPRPNYQKIIVHDLHTRMLLPSDLAQFRSHFESMSIHGQVCEGLDYVMESCNREAKRHLPPGVPTEKEWNCVYRSQEQLKQNRENCFKFVGLHDPCADCHPRCREYGSETEAVRKATRTSKVLSEAEVESDILCWSSKQSAMQLGELRQKADANRKIFVGDYIRNAKPNLRGQYPQTPSEESIAAERLAVLGLVEIERRIELYLGGLESAEDAEYGRQQWEKVREDEDIEQSAGFCLQLCAGFVTPPRDQISAVLED